MVGKKRGPKRTREAFSPEAARIGKTVEKKLAEKGFTEPQLAELVGISQQQISNIVGGLFNPNNPQQKWTLSQIARKVGHNLGLSWLHLPQEIRVVAKIAAGRPIDETDEGTIVIDTDFIHLSGDVCALRVSGKSMVADHILDKDILICRRIPDNKPTQNSIVVVDIKDDEGAAVKRWKRQGNIVLLTSDPFDEDAESYPYPLSKIGRVFEIIGLIRRVK